MLVTGRRAFSRSPQYRRLTEFLKRDGFKWIEINVDSEPTVEFIDGAVDSIRLARPDVVVGIGGGSVLDAAKAIAGLARCEYSVLDFLEGVGCGRVFDQIPVPLIAVPTTAGTGSEVTKNAVIGQTGSDGFKKSFRDEALIAHCAIVDPDFLASCPPELISANGMDALTQLMESFVSLGSNPYSRAVASSGLRAVARGLLSLYDSAGASPEARSNMAYAATVSGIVLAQTGLGSVHGLAAPLGARFSIPHGVCCGRLVAQATRINLDALLRRTPESGALEHYAEVAVLLGAAPAGKPIRDATGRLADHLTDWTERLRIPRLAEFGFRSTDIAQIVPHARGSSMRTNPIELSDSEIGDILRAVV